MVVLGTNDEAPVIERMPTEQNLLQSLYDRIGCRTVDVVSLRINGTDVTAWVDDEGAFTQRERMNAQAMRLVATLGRPGLMLFGTMVITGGADHDGNALGLPKHIADQVAAHATDSRRGVDRLILRALIMNGMPMLAVERIAANLGQSRLRAGTSQNPAPAVDQPRHAERGAGDGQVPTTDDRHRNPRMASRPHRQDPTPRHGNGPTAGPGTS
ncbi:DUF3846 domain-containing protein [Pseudonocardia sp. CA-107938]|uniref:DUF3846 domain-containing protein n=1 Tax=Pseudonocardia sp. CA-107938 TaxID=3240021 RepID=UPI003D8CAA08